ncbi:MAG TPA: bifunctional 5,10-methylenetetrahydrofolate dehydrogenase/5,10-methenyltetrahydrofolate cyclohydrolase [Candidatus Lachnoclostridium stercorigallinarum]|uniref:Bifunctional protein FolD n=1 Tax=Candidatus Lachnoclostridium stercorigallinarum TaxID=2838634 RepID=A0A9D2GHB7_9FIRM|nr:bifunctional 5,10-methylenetetrahydrofolate dehydrogenase/5,10-methenyltetrahydrofolate cyclohydrolase [Candidatus Lachnoclostridium stercorigallinarum]
MVSLKGAEVSAKIQTEVERQLEELGGYVPTLAIVRVGEKPDDLSYERGALSRMKKYGLGAVSYAYPQDISMEEFREEFRRINEDEEVDGILLLKPLPPQLDEKEIERMIDPVKDLDGISPENIARVFSGDETGFAPCTAEAVVRILKGYGVSMEGKRAVIVGRSPVVGRPLAMLFLKEHATVTVCHTRTRELERVCREAEILVAAAGNPRMIGADHVREGAVAVDVGINVDENGKLCGDMDFEAVAGKASMVTPVPGGVGAVTTSVLAEHLVRAAAMRRA